MPNSVFDLGGELTVDTTQLDSLAEQAQGQLAQIDGQEVRAKVNVDDNQARSSLTAVEVQAKAVGREIEKPRKMRIDTSTAKADLSGWRDSLRNDIFGPLDREIEQMEAKIQEMKSVPSAPAAGGMLAGRSGAMIGGTMMAGGLLGAYRIGSWAIQGAQAENLMKKSTAQVFGTASENYQAEAKAMAEATGYLTTEILAAQIAMNKTVVQTGLSPDLIQPLTRLAGDLAASSGLPQYANNIAATTNAIEAGLKGTDAALLDFGIRLDDLYVLSLPVNAGFKRLAENITPAQMAQARYNALLEQTATIAGEAAKTGEDTSASMRHFNSSMEEAKAAVGEVLLPIANTIGDFVAKIPKPLLEAGIWAGIGAAMATAIGGAIIGLNALIVAIRSLGRQATVSAVETALGGGGGKSLLGNLLGKVAKGATVAGGGAAAAGGTVAGGWVPAVGAAGFEAAAGGGGGMTAATIGTAAGTSVAALAGVAAAAAGLEMAMLRLDYETTKTWKTVAKSEAKRSESLEVLTAKRTGMGNIEDPEQAPYVFAKWSRDYRTGELIAFNKFTQRLGAEAQEFQKARLAQQQGRIEAAVTIVDQTTGGVRATSLNAGSYSPSPY